jgi:hypothetical protein
MNKKSIENIFQNCGVSHPKRSTYFHSFDWDLSLVLELVTGYNVNQQREDLSVAMSRSHKLITLASNTTHKIV